MWKGTTALDTYALQSSPNETASRAPPHREIEVSRSRVPRSRPTPRHAPASRTRPNSARVVFRKRKFRHEEHGQRARGQQPRQLVAHPHMWRSLGLAGRFFARAHRACGGGELSEPARRSAAQGSGEVSPCVLRRPQKNPGAEAAAAVSLLRRASNICCPRGHTDQRVREKDLPGRRRAVDARAQAGATAEIRVQTRRWRAPNQMAAE